MPKTFDKEIIDHDNLSTRNWQPPATVRVLVYTFFTVLSLEEKNYKTTQSHSSTLAVLDYTMSVNYDFVISAYHCHGNVP